MSEKLKGTLIKEPEPASLLRGSLVDPTEPSAESGLRGSLLEKRAAEVKTSPIPDDYHMPPETVEKVIAKRDNPELPHAVDPDGIVAPGLLLDSATTPGKRRLVTNLYTTLTDGRTLATVHTEGEKGVRTFNLSALHRNITDGQLIPIVPPQPKA